MTDTPSIADAAPSRTDFRTTAWTQIAAVRSPERRDEALRRLFAEYWRPVYAYLRRRYALGDEDGRDRTQEFFLWTLESGLFEKADRRRGSFRGLLKTALRNFVFGEHRKAGRRKRGGGAARVSLEFTELPALDAALGPDEALDAQWRRDVMHRALRAVGGEAAELARAFYFDRRSYEQIAEARGMSAKDVENRLAGARKRLAMAVADVVAETVEGPDALRGELRALFQ